MMKNNMHQKKKKTNARLSPNGFFGPCPHEEAGFPLRRRNINDHDDDDDHYCSLLRWWYFFARA